MKKTLEKHPATIYNGDGNNSACQERSLLSMTGDKKKHVSASLQVEDGKYVVRARVYDPTTGRIRQRSKTTGLSVKGNKRRAEEMLKRFVADWERESNAEVIHANPLFSESVKLWLEHKSAVLRESTITAYEYNINGHILPRFGKMRTREISMYHIRGFYDELLKTLSAKTVRKIHLIILGVMKDAVMAGIRPDNPASGIELPTAAKYEGKAYSIEQVAQLLKAIEQEGEPIRAAITLGLGYGLRRSEICGLRWKDIDFERNTMHICNTVVENAGHLWEKEATKTAKSNRTLDLGTFFVQYLKDLKAMHESAGTPLDKVCQWPDGTAVTPSYISHKQQKVLKKYGLEKLRLHDLRHTAASLMAKRATLNQVRDFLGHEDISTTYGIYVHTDLEDMKIAASIMDEVFQKAEICSEACSEHHTPT